MKYLTHSTCSGNDHGGDGTNRSDSMRQMTNSTGYYFHPESFLHHHGVTLLHPLILRTIESKPLIRPSPKQYSNPLPLTLSSLTSRIMKGALLRCHFNNALTLLVIRSSNTNNTKSRPFQQISCLLFRSLHRAHSRHHVQILVGHEQGGPLSRNKPLIDQNLPI